ncbi:hypothetical protein [uncultured Pedobacter sp.]|uniref:hypothetical protein n=1 Tax=uncultured Pedobacter sp. TaxID=246139 RepID=UPI0025E909EE|nr:hypothetical protein [uncultured Pedobacter sp.]
MILKNYSRLLLIAGLCLSVSACKKDKQVELNTIDLGLPSTVSLVYGQEQDISLPASVQNATDASISLDFSQVENLQVNTSTTLRDQLSRAIVFDKTTGKLHVNSMLLYPNSSVSSTSGNKIPESYKVAVQFSSKSQGIQARQTFELKISPAKLTIKGLDNQSIVPFAYVLYGNAAAFELEAPAAWLTNSKWTLENQATLGTEVSFVSNKLSFGANAGDPAKKAEKAYDLIPVLQKDGFTIASRAFKVTFIPQIKFFYGTYYADLNLTVLTNSIYIALSNGYLSASPTLYPEQYKSTFSIASIEKNGVAIDNNDGIFGINEKTGSVIVKKNTTLTQGSYKFTVIAKTTTGLEFSTTLTLNMEKG